MEKIKFQILILPYVFCFLSLFGCASLPMVSPVPPEGISGSYHRVEKGQTLWRISKIYDIDLEELVRINHISNSANIEIGQLIFIPHLRQAQSSSALAAVEDFNWPVRGRVIAGFGDSINSVVNQGINIQPYSSLNVLASRAGKVVFCAPDFKGYGNTIIVDHGDGFSTVYARNAQVFVKAGDIVRKGNTIARIGSAGRDKNKYLHFQIRKGHIAQNPNFYLPRQAGF